MASLGTDPADLIKLLFGGRGTILPVPRYRTPETERYYNQMVQASKERNSGSLNRPGFGLSDFGLPPRSPGADFITPSAPNVTGAAKHGGNQLRQAAINAITAQYGPVLGAINNAMGSARSQAASDIANVKQTGNRAVGDLAVLYNRLGKYARNTQRAQDQQYRGGIKNTKNNFNNLIKDVNRTYGDTSANVANELQRLGINPNTMGANVDDQMFERNMIRNDRANHVMNQRESRHEYDAGMGRMRNDIIATGNAAIGNQQSITRNNIAQINRDLSSQIMQLQMQRATTVGQRAAAMAQYHLSQLQARQAAKDPNNALDLMLKQIQVAKGLKDLKSDGTSSATTKTPKGMADALAYLNSVYPTTNANWSTTKRNQLEQMLQDIQLQGSRSEAPEGMKNWAPWDPKQMGDLWQILASNMQGVKGPKGNPMYGSQDTAAMRQALAIALGMM